MKKVKKKFHDLEKMQKEISDKLDNYEYNFNNEHKKANDISDFTFQNNNNNNNFESCVKIDKDYRKILNKRLDNIMGRINDNIINQNYIDFYNFLHKGKKNKSKNSKQPILIQNLETSNDKINKIGSNNNTKIINEDEQNIKSKNIKRGNEIDNMEDNKINIIKNNNNRNEIEHKNIININNEISNNDINKDNNFNIEKEIKTQNNINDIKKMNIHISYNPEGKINLEDFQNQQKLEFLHKQHNIFLGNELTLLKCKLNKIRKENEFLQSLIHEKGMVKNSNVLEKFIGEFVEKLSLNWNEIVENIIDGIIIDEIHELSEIELNKVNYEKNKIILINNLYKAGYGGIIPDKPEDNTNVDLLTGNIEQIKKILNTIKESENNIKAKYNI